MPARGLRERIEQQQPITALRMTVPLLRARNRPIWLIGHPLWAIVVVHGKVWDEFGIGAQERRNGSSVGRWLALRPQFSAQARMPTTALRASRREAWVSRFDRGAGARFPLALRHRPGCRVPTRYARGSSPLFLRAAAIERRGRPSVKPVEKRHFRLLKGDPPWGLERRWGARPLEGLCRLKSAHPGCCGGVSRSEP
jgi:hypothetical protein